MSFLDIFVMAIKSLLANKLRSSLTMLGIVIGVGAVISLMSLGRGAETMITSTIQDLGSNVLYVVPRSTDVSGFAGFSPAFTTPSLTLEDARALERIPSIAAIAPVNENFVEVTAGGESQTTVIDGTTPEYQISYNFFVASGQFISDKNVVSRDLVAVLGSQLAEDLFGSQDPLGQRVNIKGFRFTVIGVLEPKGGAFMGVSLDSVVVVPITTFQTRLFIQRTPGGEDAVQSIALKVASADAINDVISQSEALLRKRHRLAETQKNDFSIVSQEQIIGIFSQITSVFTIFLGAIASISLIVGGIGIMNIMLVSVTERTREIGIRKAVGAKRRHILLQFLVEAASLSLAGGVIGIMGGWLVSFAVSQVDLGGFKLQATVTPDVVLLAVSVSVMIGLVSGIYPAVRAARLSPIDALHYG